MKLKREIVQFEDRIVFAWYPVFCRDSRTWVWMEKVRRMRRHYIGCYTGLDRYLTDYQELPGSPL